MSCDGRGAAGATALRGVWGFRGGGEPHGDRVVALRRDVPLIVEAVDAPEKAEKWREIALELAREEGFVHSQPVSRAIARSEEESALAGRKSAFCGTFRPANHYKSRPVLSLP